MDEEESAKEDENQNSWVHQVEKGERDSLKVEEASKEVSKEVSKEEESKEVSKEVAKEEVSKEALKEDENQNGNPARQGLNRHNGC